MSITSKEWVIPPRPKPGRKPATDTPPTKRKAQNRAAQRAFRERRAARVGELEDQLDEQKNENDKVQQDYQDQIRNLETEVQVLRSRCQMLETLLEKEKAAPSWAGPTAIAKNKNRRDSSPSLSLTPHSSIHQQQVHGHILSPIPQKRLHSQPRGSTSSSISSASGRRTSAQPFSISQIISPPEEADDLTCGSCNSNGSGSCACVDEVLAATSAMGCGKCSIGTKCECLEKSLQAFSSESCMPDSDLKRPHPPASPSTLAPDEKKVRHSQSANGTEIDFTHMFSQSKQISARTPLPSMPGQQVRQQPQQQVMRMEIPLKDKCGFCSDGTYCVCADTMPGVTMTGSLALTAGTVIAQQKTPPPSENDGVPSPLEVTATGAIKLSSMNSLRRQNKQAVASQAGPLPPLSLCSPRGPGTCAQCLADPVSGLFCRSLAASFERSGGGGEKGGGCCGGGGPGGCCKNKGADGAAGGETKDDRKTGAHLSLSCADAYKTLSSHRHFDEATDEIGTWLPMLKAVPRKDGSAQPAERHPMEVEAASIMSVLKGFDVRFGK